jgi:GAF domain-containing protein
MLENAVSICEANFGNMYFWNGQTFDLTANFNTPPSLVEYRKRYPVCPTPEDSFGRVLATKAYVQIADVTSEKHYLEGRDPSAIASVELGGIRTVVVVPMLKDDELIGLITVYRQEVRPFTDKQIELVKNFAAQAVIAIENARLLNELRERTADLMEALDQQTATSDVLQVISSSPEHLEPVFTAMLEKAVRVCKANFGGLYRAEGNTLRVVATHNIPHAYAEVSRSDAFRPNPESLLGHIIARKTIVHFGDVTASSYMQQRDPATIAAVQMANARTLVMVPMLKDEKLIGIFGLARTEVRPFSDKEIELIKNFANQAVVAIENARLLGELRQRTDDLTQSLEDLRATQDRLVQTQKLASLGQLTAGIAHEIKNPLNFVNNFSGVSTELIDELRDALGRMTGDDKTRAEIAQLADTLRDNLNKILQHGKRADAIVKNMLLHSREGSGEHRSVDVNSLVEESLNLAYHGARAESSEFQDQYGAVI